MYCASSPFGCPSLTAKGRRNRLNAISQLPRHQGWFLWGPFRAFRKGVLVKRRVVTVLALGVFLYVQHPAQADQPPANDFGGQIISGVDGKRVGIGTTLPAATLDVYRGEIKIGSTGARCTKDLNGALRSENSKLQFCDGANWRNVSLDKGQ
jgi:hypothetical protein